MELSSCLELQSLSSLAKLRFLESLRLHDLPNLEYIESYSAKDMMLGSSVEGLQIFPRLVFIALYSLPNLKGWFTPLGETVSDDNQISSNKESQHSSLLFPVLKYLVITNCPELTSFPNCLKLTDLTLCLFNERLRITETPTSPKLEQVTIDNLTGLQHLLPIQSFQSLTLLTLRFNSEVESLNDFRQILCDCFSSLQTIEISLCSKIRTVFGGLSYLDSLNSLTLGNLPVLNLANEEIDENNEDESVGLGSLCHTLRHLHISYCGALVTFPKWMRKLTSLQQLKVMGCSPVLKERCQNPTGEDWPNIRHILSVSITERKYNNLT
ncbi:uncharacterized protein LOC141617941 [Silene latifolia]|uniref:uncharacterized protein LOC141617941 n=1 Tax=Silene latifolia TaxID=37657 RepID=UPI003D772C84